MPDDKIRVLVCGSRTFSDAQVIREVLDGVSQAHAGNVLIIQGAARGADACAGAWAVDNDKPMLAYAADWVRYGKRAGYLRNVQMLEDGRPDVVWAFVDKPLAESKGTKMMVDIARKADARCYVVDCSNNETL